MPTHRRRLLSVLLLLALSACRGAGSPTGPESSESPIAVAVPGWCGGIGSGGPPPASGVTLQPAGTMDPNFLMCIASLNHSSAAMGLNETQAGRQSSWTRLYACSGTAGSERKAAVWSLQVAKAGDPSGIGGPILATLDSSQMIGSPPYLIEVSIDADGKASIRQTDHLPDDPTAKLC
jgi:hypothetical protein